MATMFECDEPFRFAPGVMERKCVIEVHDLHIWRISADRVALSAHLVIHHHDTWPVLLLRLNRILKERYGIEHVTLQAVWRSLPNGKHIPIHEIKS